MSAVEAWAAQITVEQLDEDPYPIYAQMRREAPVCFVPAVGLWFVTRWADVELATTNPELIDSSVTPSPLDRVMGGPSILVLDGPPQKKLRAMLDPSMRPRVVEATSPQLVAAIVEERLDAIADRGEAELMSEYFEPVSVLSLGSVLGPRRARRRHLAAVVPRSRPRRDQLRGRSRQVGRLGRDRGRHRPRARTRSRTAVGGTRREHDRDDAAACRGLVRRARGGGSADAEGDPARGMQEPGHAAGSTVAGLLESGQAAAVAADPGRARPGCDRGRAALGLADRDADPSCVVETELGGVTLPVGANLGVLVSSANRDEEIWGPTADAYDLFRPRRNHAAFGFGPHFCSGPSLLACADADRGAAALRAAAEPSGRSRPTGRIQRLGVPGAAASPRALGRLMVDLGPSISGLPISRTAISARRRPRALARGCPHR